MGSGKSTLSNILALDDDLERIHFGNVVFPTSKTTSIQVRLLKSEKITNDKMLRVIDVPGVSSESEFT